MLWVYLFMAIGCAMVGSLGNRAVKDWPAVSILVGGCLSWFFSAAQAVVVVWNSARQAAEAQAIASMGFDKPLPEIAPVTRFSYDDTPTHKLYVSLPIPPAKVRNVAQAYSMDRDIPFSEPEWVTRRRILSAREFRTLQAEALGRGWLQPKGADPRQGYKLGRAGLHILHRIADGTIRPEVSRLPY